MVERRTPDQERSRVRVSPTALSSTALGQPLTHTYLNHQAVNSSLVEGQGCTKARKVIVGLA